MLKVTIIAVGKIKKNYLSEALREYLKMLSPYAKINIEEIQAEAFNESNKEKSKRKEWSKIKKVLNKYPSGLSIFLDENGDEYTSRELANYLKKNESQHLIFIIGGSLGYDDEIKKISAKRISLSRMTFPHELARVILVEQLYRSVTIIKEKNYHY